jgi:phosphatidate cytidylyltransferase
VADSPPERPDEDEPGNDLPVLAEADEPFDDDEPHARRRLPMPHMPQMPSGLGSRLAIAVPGILIAIGLVVVGGALFALVMAVLAALALFEFYSLTAGWLPLRWAGYLSALLPIAFAWTFTDSEHGILLGLAVGLGCVAIAGLILARREDVTARLAVTALGGLYVGLPLAILVATRELPHGGAAVANVLVGTWVFDTASYVGGRTWGRRKIAPRTSPGKTVEGAIVGFVVATLAVGVAGLYMDWIDGWQSLVLGAVICVAALPGDLFESLLKRDAGAKDSGRLLLGHGGVLDRFDALFFASLANYFVTVWLVY